MRIDYVIYAQSFISNSAGIRALYILADRLNRKGYRTYVTSSFATDPTLRAPLISLTLAKRLALTQDYTAVYPETIPGNPLGAKKVVRWVLNRPGLLDGEEIYDSQEVVFNYANAYASYIKNQVHGKLYLPTIDQTLFFPPAAEGPRTREYFYVGKAQYREGFFDREKVIEITRDSPHRSTLGDLLRQAKVLYCFDNSTIFAYEAVMCGCPVVVIPDGTQTRADYEKQELGMHGIAWGPTELARAHSTVHLMAPFYEAAKVEFERELDRFIELTAPGKPPGPVNAQGDYLNVRELEETIATLSQDLIQVYNSKYFVLRSLLKSKLPLLDRLFSRLARLGYYPLRTVHRQLNNRREKRRIENEVERRRKLLQGNG